MSPDKKKKANDQSEDTDLEDQETDDQSSEDLDSEDESTGEEDQSSSEEGKGKGKKKESQEDDFSFVPEDIDSLPDGVKKRIAEVDKRMKAAFNKKHTELDQRFKGKRVIDNFDSLLNDEEFVSWADKILADKGMGQGGQSDVTQLSQDEAVRGWMKFNDQQRTLYFTNLKPEQREIFRLKLQINHLASTSARNREEELHGKALASYGDTYKGRKTEVDKLRREIQRNPYLGHDEAFKILDYEDYGKRQFDAGKLEGEKNVKDKTKGTIRSGRGSGGGTTGTKKAGTMKEAYESASDDSK